MTCVALNHSVHNLKDILSGSPCSIRARSVPLRQSSSPRSEGHSAKASKAKMAVRRVTRGVIFDMDGTLTLPVIDFQEMRRRANILTGDILDAIAALPAEQQKETRRIIEEVEEEALAKMAISPGVVEVCSFLDQAKVPRALLTRNNPASVEYFHKKHFSSLPPFSPALSRDFRPYKPSPAAVLHICQGWGIPPNEAVVIGDSAKDDVVCANRAGAASILIDESGDGGKRLEGEQIPTHVARSLHDVLNVLQNEFQLAP